MQHGPRDTPADTALQRSAALQDELQQLLATALELHAQGNVRQAVLLYRAILSVDGGHAEALHRLGIAAHSAGDFQEASELIAQAALSNPDAPHYHFNLGVSLQALHRHADAAAAYRQAIAARADYREAYENLGVALQDLGELEAAADAYRRALALDPAAPAANQNLGTLLGNLGRTDEAREHFAKVLNRHPLYGDAHMKRAWTLLLDGRFSEGWREYEWREHAASFVENNPARVVPFPRWDGSSLTDKTILIHPEQGIGDQIMFASCYRDVIAAARHCVIECDPRLANVFERSFPGTTVLPGERRADFRWSAEMPSIDYRIPAGSLPRFYRNALEDFPAAPAYLLPDATRQTAWRERLAAFGQTRKIGISWRGGREARSSAARSVPLTEWQAILGVPDCTFINLQYGDHSAEIAAAQVQNGASVHTLEGVDPLTDLDGFLALISTLDLVISIDNSTVFMAGAIGTPVWILLPSTGEWRWLKKRTTSPWHPSALLFRQREPGLPAWRETLGEVALRLQSRVRSDVPSAQPLRAASPHGRLARSSSRASMAAVLVNDTSHWYHFGCSCTTLALHAELRASCHSIRSLPIHDIVKLAELPTSLAAFDDDSHFARFAARYPQIVALLRSADTVYVNGEGSLHGVSSASLGLLYLMHVAKTRLDRTVHLINHSCYPDDGATVTDHPAFALYRKVYEQLDFIAVREEISAALVSQMGVTATPSFDCLPLFIDRYYEPNRTDRRKRVLVAGSASWGGRAVIADLAEYVRRVGAAGYEVAVLVGANAYLAADDVAFVEALRADCKENIQIVAATSELEWLRAIAESALLVSGRFHHTLAAAFVDTPFVVMESNTPKIAGIMQMLRSSAFLSVHEASLSEALYERSSQRLLNAEEFNVPADVKAELRELARLNFRRATAG